MSSTSYNLKDAFIALLNKAVLASLNVPEADRMTPRYLYLFTHSRFSVSILKLWLIILHPQIKTLLHLFDHMIKPIARYGVEIWGLLTPAMLKKKLELYDLFKDWEYEKLNLKFCKYLLGAIRKLWTLILNLHNICLYANFLICKYSSNLKVSL
jgi:hypothetical protein